MALPRLERLWQRQGIGLHQGIVVGRTYYTVTDDRTRLVALDPTTGRDLWQTRLPKPLGGYPRLARVGNRIVVGCARQKEEDIQLLEVSMGGLIGWSRAHPCKRAEIESAGERLFLRCHPSAPLRGKALLIEIDTADGTERSRSSVDRGLTLMPTGDFCTADERRVACFRLVGDQLRQRWSTPVANASRYARLQGTAAAIVRSDETSVDTLRANDGQRLFHRDLAREGGRWIDRELQNDRLFLFGPTGVEILRIPDGHHVARFTWHKDRGNRLLAAESQTLIDGGLGGEPRAGLIDRQGTLVRVELPLLDFRTPVGDVVLAHGVAPPRYHVRDGALSAYSLSRLAAPAANLSPYERVVAILGHHADPYGAFDVLSALREMPDGLDYLEKVIRQDRGYARITAIAVAGASGLLRFLPALRDALQEMASPPETAAEREGLLQTVHATASLDSPQAAEVLLAYWQKAEPLFATTDLHWTLKTTVEATVWRYSGARDWAACPDRSFPTGERDPTKAMLGTASPGSGDVLDRSGRWALLCQARNDDDTDGRLSVQYKMHGGTSGDRLRPYLVLGSGAGTAVDDFLAAQPTGQHVVVAMRTCVYLVDTQTGKAKALPRADGRVRIGPKQDAPAMAFSRNGIWMAYLRSNARRVRVVIRDLTTGVEREIDPAGDSVLSLFFDNSSDQLVMDIADFEGGLQAKPWATTESDHHRCREGSERASHFGDEPAGPSFRRRHVAVHGGPVRAAEHPSQWEPDPPHPARYRLVPAVPSTTPVELPTGPFQWQK